MAITIDGMRESTFGQLISKYAPDELHLFDSLRVFIEENGNFWFIGSEVASIMGYTNPWKAIRDHVPEQYKRRVFNENHRPNESFGLLPGNEDIVLIHELGLYALAMRSKLPQAYQFQDWVYRVISRIRQYGGYISPNSNLLQVVDIIPEQYRQSITNMIETKNRVIERQQNDIEFRNSIIRSNRAIINDQRENLRKMVDLFQIMLNTVIE